MRLLTFRRARAAVVCFLLLACSAGSARAQQGDSQATLAEALTGAAKDAYVSARILLNNGDSAGASAKFAEAYELSHDPRLLFNMAVCARNAHAYARMQKLLRRYKQTATFTMSESTRQDVDNALVAIANLVATVQVNVNEADVTVLVDGEAVGTTPLSEPLQIDMGRHVVALRKAGFAPVERIVDAAGGASLGENFVLVPAEAAAATARLVVTSDRAATIRVDALPAATARVDATLTPGLHRVRVSEPDKIARDETVDLRENETRTMEMSLRGRAATTGAWPWIVGAVALGAGAAVGGYFLFKPVHRTISPTGDLSPVVLP